MAGLRRRGTRRRARGRCDLQRLARDRIHRRASDDRRPRLADRAPGIGGHPAARVDCDDRRPAGHADSRLHDHQAPHDPRRRGDPLGLGRCRSGGRDRGGCVHDRAGGGRRRHAEERSEQLRRIREHGSRRARGSCGDRSGCHRAGDCCPGACRRGASQHTTTAKVRRTRPRRLRTRRATSRRPSGRTNTASRSTRPRRTTMRRGLACARDAEHAANLAFPAKASTL